MAVGLGKIAKHSASERIKLFGEQTHVIATGQQPIKELATFFVAALQYIVIDEPEAARQKGALTRRQSIGGIFRFIAKDKFAVDQ
jgi:hypothetical protein